MSDFNYENMTPELKAYLDQPGRPSYEYPKDNEGKTLYNTPTPESKALVEAWQTEHDRLKAAATPEVIDAYYKAQKVWYCRDETATGESREHVSPNGQYKLVVTMHTTGTGTWNYSKGKVYVGDRLITEVCRNYAAFPFAWVEKHAGTGHDYLVCGEDFQGQTVVNLVTGQRVDSLPRSAAEGFGFCWAGIHPSPDGKTLAVEGCYWACPYEVILVDFTTPMTPPWLVLDRDEDDDFAGWNPDGTCNIGRRFEVVDLPGHPLHGKKDNDCTMEELEQVEAYVAEHEVQASDDSEAGWKVVKETHLWTRPENVVMVRNHLRLHVPWVEKHGGEYHHDIAVQFRLMWEACSQVEREVILADGDLGPMAVKVQAWAEKALSEPV